MHSENHINNIDHMLSHILCLWPNAKINVWETISAIVILSDSESCFNNCSTLYFKLFTATINIQTHVCFKKKILVKLPCQNYLSCFFAIYLQTNERMVVINFLWKVVRKLHRVQNQMHIMWNFQISNLIITLNTMSYQFTHFSNTF